MSVTPENAPIRPAYVRDKNTGLYYKLAVQGLPGSGSTGGVSDHGLLTGLTDADHPIAAVQGLQAALDAKAPTAHSHALGDLPTTLATDAEVTTVVSNHAATAGHELLSTTTPAPLGTAAVGNGTTTARANHVHAMPTAAQVGAAATAHTHTLDELSDVATAGATSGQAIVYNGSSWGPGSVAGTTPGRNRIINGDFSVNQRGFTSGISTTAQNVYGADRWIGAGQGGTTTYSVVAAALGELPESATQFARIVTSGSTGVAAHAELMQRIESVRILSGKTATISFWAKASAALKIGVHLTQYFGGSGGPSSDVWIPTTPFTISTTWARYSVTVAIPSIAGKIISTSGGNFPDYLLLRIFVSMGASGWPGMISIGEQDGTFDFWGVQVEEGSVATPYELNTYQQELLACQRYYVRWNAEAATKPRYADGICFNSNNIVMAPLLPVQMRILPQVTYGGTFTAENFVGDLTVSSIVMSGSGPTSWNQFLNVQTVVASATPGGAYELYGSAGSWLAFSADI